MQGDPFATPSRVRLIVKNKGNFDTALFDQKHRKIATEDEILRNIHRFLKKQKGNGRTKNSTLDYGRSRAGSGKSGQIFACRVRQEVMERMCVLISEEQIEVHLEVGFPAYGRTIAAGELEKILFQTFPAMVKEVFTYQNTDMAHLKQVVELADDQQYIREELKRQDLVAFIADGAVLPRESGISDLPLKSAIKFESPESLRIQMTLPHYGEITGMGIKSGVTLIAGGGYHGKSTLLKAIQNGVYNQIGRASCRERV